MPVIALRTESPSMASYPSPPNQARTTEENQEIDKNSGAGSPGITDLRSESESVEQGRQLLIENGEKKERYLTIFKVIMGISMFLAFTTFSLIRLSTSYSIPDTQTSTSWKVMNLCWFSSLVLSVASAANTRLGITIVLHQSDFLLPPVHPRHRILRAWYGSSPELLLMFAWFLFLIGAWAFTYATHQGIFTQIIVATLNLVTFVPIVILVMYAIVTNACCPSLQLKPQ
ncbi:hypothetical protein SCHPADRAFT_945622 [Schizopora paradoxa]|uniref:Uncharacterized protein n=1 Tax=Schizopora paradoxa TaxID=27342 RepID=A0A0H2R588_9AGAM|nr:hypothetical protein SCHPADRAFT_945622 [Schizopora paradoxa]